MILETSRLIIRPFDEDDLHAIHRILDLAFGDGSKIADEDALNERREWLEWSRLSAEWLPRLFQPPYGDRAVVLKSSNEVIGAVRIDLKISSRETFTFFFPLSSRLNHCLSNSTGLERNAVAARAR